MKDWKDLAATGVTVEKRVEVDPFTEITQSLVDTIMIIAHRQIINDHCGVRVIYRGRSFMELHVKMNSANESVLIVSGSEEFEKQFKVKIEHPETIYRRIAAAEDREDLDLYGCTLFFPVNVAANVYLKRADVVEVSPLCGENCDDCAYPYIYGCEDKEIRDKTLKK